jgi:hypothetical protein
MQIDLPRGVATRLWQMALEAPQTICGVIQKKQQNYHIETCDTMIAAPDEWATHLIAKHEQPIWAYYQSFYTEVPLAKLACWQGLPPHCVLFAIMLDTKGLLGLKAFVSGGQGVHTVDVSLAQE